MSIKINYQELEALKPCIPNLVAATQTLGGLWGAGAKVVERISAEQAKAAGVPFSDILWVASELARTNPDVARRLQLWASDCAARVLHIYEKSETSDAPRNAIIAGRLFARGEISDAARGAAKDAAWAANDAIGAAWAANAARSTAYAAASAAAAWAAAARYAAWAAGTATNSATATDAEEKWQFDRLVEWLSDNEPADWPLPVVSIIKAV